MEHHPKINSLTHSPTHPRIKTHTPTHTTLANMHTGTLCSWWNVTIQKSTLSLTCHPHPTPHPPQTTHSHSTRSHVDITGEYMCAAVPTTVWCVGGHVTGSVRLRTVLGNDRQVIVALSLPVKGGLGADNGCVAGGPWHYLKIVVGPLQGKR